MLDYKAYYMSVAHTQKPSEPNEKTIKLLQDEKSPPSGK